MFLWNFVGRPPPQTLNRVFWGFLKAVPFKAPGSSESPQDIFWEGVAVLLIV